jgi:predicted permease
VLLAIGGAGAGLLLAGAALPVLVNFVPAQLNILGVTASINGRVIAWSAVLTIGSAVLVALLPLLQSRRAHPQDALKSDGRGTTAARTQLGVRNALIVAEIALSVILLVGAGLMARSLARLQAVEPGFDPHSVLTMRITLPREKYRGPAANEFFQALVDALEQTPGVRAASVASQFPPQGPFSTTFRFHGMDASGSGIPTALMTTASEEHFAALGVRQVAGRLFESADRADAPRVVVVNQAFVSRFLPGVAPIGHRVSTGPADRASPAMEIVGVVTNTRNRGAREPASPEIFVPMHQQTVDNQMYLLVRSDGDAAAMLPAVRRQIARLDPEQPVYAVRTLEAALEADTFRLRFPMTLFGIFAVVALTLAALGIYGVMSYAVSARTQEIGVRLAVGADRAAVLWLVLRQVLRLTLIGLTIGLAGAFALSGAVRRALFEVQPTDPLTLAAVTVVLGSVALVAGWLPAWRASRVDPVRALRND